MTTKEVDMVPSRFILDPKCINLDAKSSCEIPDPIIPIGVGGNILMLPYFGQKLVQETKIFRINWTYSLKDIFKFIFDPDPKFEP